MNTRNYYNVLLLPKDATNEDIKRAYRNAARSYHPDKKPINPNHFPLIQEAYETLSDSKKRAEHDDTLKRSTGPSRVIVVFGQSKAGKTSMLNALLRRNERVSDSVAGCTFESTPLYPFDSPKGCENDLFWDTAGLNEWKEGTVPSDQSISQLLYLLRSTKSGINLLIFVVKIGPITEVMRKNYDLFVTHITGEKIPVICVVTGCENVEDSTEWAQENKELFNKAGMRFDAFVPACFAAGGRFEQHYKEIREVSVENVWSVICTTAAPKPIHFIEEKGTLWYLLRILGKFFGFSYLNRKLKDLLILLGVSEEKADKLSREPDFQ